MSSSALVSVIDVHDPPTGMGLSPLVGNGVAIETGEIQKYFNLWAADTANQSAVLQFGGGKVYVIDDTITIPGGVGGCVRSGGLSHGGGGHTRWNYTTTFTVPNNYNQAMFYVKSHGGLVLEGIMMDGLDRDAGGIGLEVVANSVDGRNGAMHSYRNCAWAGLTQGWQHDRNSVGGANSNGDRYHFENCEFRFCENGVWINSAGDMQTWLDHVAFSSTRYPILLGDGQSLANGGQLRCTNIFLSHGYKFIRTYDSSGSNAGIFVQGVKMDDSGQVYRMKLYEELGFGSNSDGRTRGPVVFDQVNYAINVRCEGTIRSISDVGGLATLHLLHLNGSSSPTVRVGDLIHLHTTGIDQYDWDGPNKVEFTATATSTDGGTELTVPTDIPYVSDPGAVGTWYEVTPIFKQLGGSRLIVRDSFIPPGMVQDASLATSQNSAWANDRASQLFFERVTYLPQPISGTALDTYIRLTDPEGTGTTPSYKFHDCSDVATYDPPWSENNYENSMDWTAEEREQIRFRLSLDGVQATPAFNVVNSLPAQNDTITSALATHDAAVNTRFDTLDTATSIIISNQGIMDTKLDQSLVNDGVIDGKLDQSLINQGNIETKVDTSLANQSLMTSKLDQSLVNQGNIEAKVDTSLVNQGVMDGKLDQSLSNEANMEVKIDNAITNQIIMDAKLDQSLINDTNIETKIDTALATQTTMDGKLDQSLVNQGKLQDDLDIIQATQITMDGKLDQSLLNDTSIESKVDTSLANQGVLDAKLDQSLTNDATIQDSLTTLILLVQAIDTSQGRDWTDTERSQLRYRQGVNGAQIPPSTTPRTSIAGQARVISAASAGVTNDAGGASETFRDINTGANVFTVTYDEDENRVSVTFNDS